MKNFIHEIFSEIYNNTCDFSMEKDKWWTCFESEVSSTASSICLLTDDVVAQLSNNGWGDQFAEIQLSLEEALINAVKHGNKFSPDKKILFRCCISADIVRFIITDMGNGFAPDNVHNPTQEEYLTRLNGRGIHLMKTFMNRVEYNSKGNSVFMEKCRS